MVNSLVEMGPILTFDRYVSGEGGVYLVARSELGLECVNGWNALSYLVSFTREGLNS